jgi:hypothetical protein
MQAAYRISWRIIIAAKASATTNGTANRTALMARIYDIKQTIATIMLQSRCAIVPVATTVFLWITM